MELVYVAWLSLALLVVADVLARRREALPALPAPPAPAARGRRLLEIGLISLVVFAVRALLAAGRDVRGIDEVQYAATAAWVRDSGRSLFDWAWNLHGHQALFALGSPQDPFTAVDVLTSLAVAATGFLLAWTVLRRSGERWAPHLVAALYAYALLRFEGLSSNKEPWVGLCLAGYLLLRVGLADAGRPWLRRLAAGACLGAAAVCKEQAAAFVLLEPGLELFERWRAEEPRGESLRTFLRHQALAAAGFLAPVGLLLAGFAARGQLGAYLSFLLDWAARGGAGAPRLIRGVKTLPVFTEGLAADAPSTLTVILDGWLPLWMSAAGLLGIAHAMRTLFEPARARGLDLLVVALVGHVLLGLGAVSIGLRWSAHYWMLLVPALAPLAALRLLEVLRELRRPAQRLTAGALLALAAFTTFQEAYFLASPVGQAAMRGGGLDGPDAESLASVAEWVQQATPAEGAILVWGWRPELYFASKRVPVSRYVGGVTAGRAEVFEDLRSPRLAMVLKPPAPGWPDDELAALRDPWDLSHHPDLAELLAARGFVRRARPAELRGWTAWGPPPR